MDCLAEGRSVSLPASAVGSGKLAVAAVGAYRLAYFYCICMYVYTCIACVCMYVYMYAYSPCMG